MHKGLAQRSINCWFRAAGYNRRGRSKSLNPIGDMPRQIQPDVTIAPGLFKSMEEKVGTEVIVGHFLAIKAQVSAYGTLVSLQ